MSEHGPISPEAPQQPMRWPDRLRALVRQHAGRFRATIFTAAFLIALIGASAVAIQLSQQQSRSDILRNLGLRGTASATFVSTFIAQQAAEERAAGERVLSEPRVSPERFRVVVAATFGSTEGLLLDSSGRVLDVVPHDPALLGRQIAGYAHVGTVERAQIRVSDVLPWVVGRTPVVTVAVPFSTASGRRVFSAAYGVPGSTLEAFAAHTISYRQHDVFLVDSVGHLVAASPRTGDKSLSEADPALARAVAHSSLGPVAGARTPTTFTAARVPGTPWRLVIAVPNSRLYVFDSGWTELVPWLILALVSVLGVALVVHRILAQIRVRNQQARAEELAAQLRHAQKLDAIGRLAGGVAHDFNNMLTAIQGYSQLLLEGLDHGDPLRSSAEQISRAAAQASRLPRQLLAFSRKQQPGQRQAIDLNEVLSLASDMLSRLVPGSVELIVAPRAGSARVLADPGYLEQVILNLVVNAGEAMPDGGQLVISTRNADPSREPRTEPAAKAGPYVVLSVADGGEGMDARTKESIFEPFFTTKPGGSGLGLATVYGIVSQSGGFIHVESERGKGSLFEVWLPCAEETGRRRRAPVSKPGRADQSAREARDVVGVMQSR